jgi:hypothetical protein
MLNREIEFRGKRKDNGLWAYGNLITNIISLTGEARINGHISIDHETKFTAIVSEDGCLHEVDPETVGQFTGSYDMHDQKVYEDDYVKYYGDTYPVYYDECYGWSLNDDESLGETNSSYLEVIGNKTDNPEQELDVVHNED